MKTYLTFLRVSLMTIAVVVLTSCSKEEVYRGELPPMSSNVHIEIKPPQPLAPAELDKDVLLDLINEVRTTGCKCGSLTFAPVKPVVWSERLEDVAKVHSNDMSENMFLSHQGSDGSNPGDRLKNLGYKFSFYGENLAVGITNEERVVSAWLQSDSHCRTIMGSIYKEMGVATSGPFWSQIFASPI